MQALLQTYNAYVSDILENRMNNFLFCCNKLEFVQGRQWLWAYL